MNKYNVGGLFSGVGGIELGFERAGFEISWANEIDSYACKTYKSNFKNHLLIEDDIWNLIDNKFIYKEKSMPCVDVLVGGFPCQAFSIAGYRKGFEDPRGNLFFAILEFIKYFKPKAFMLENVKNQHNNIDKELISCKGSTNSIMAGLNCGTPSLISWPIIRDITSLFVTIGDNWAKKSMKKMYEENIIAGETGGAGIAAILALPDLFDENSGRSREFYQLYKSVLYPLKAKGELI